MFVVFDLFSLAFYFHQLLKFFHPRLSGLGTCDRVPFSPCLLLEALRRNPGPCRNALALRACELRGASG
jgi:hypothetical protein